jgi:HSP20 family protein
MNELSLFDSFINNVFSDALPDFRFGKACSVPDVDVKEDKDGYTLEMDLPGRTEKDVNLELDHNVLTISSRKEENTEKNSSEKKDESSWILRERHTNDFSRRFTLPDDVSEGNVKALFTNGVLTVRIPRRAVAAPRRIAIEAA